MCSSVLWKGELASDEIRFLAKAVSKQDIEGVARLLLTARDKMREERNDLKMELLIGKEAEHRT